MPERVQCPRIRRHRVIVEVAFDHKAQPLSLIRNWQVHTPPQLLFDHLELRPHAVRSGFPFNLEFPLQEAGANKQMKHQYPPPLTWREPFRSRCENEDMPSHT